MNRREAEAQLEAQGLDTLHLTEDGRADFDNLNPESEFVVIDCGEHGAVIGYDEEPEVHQG